MRTITPSSFKTKPARRASPHVRYFSSRIIRTLSTKTRYVDPTLAAKWGQILDHDIASLCRPGKLSGKQGDRTLEVIVRHGAAATKIHMQSDEIIRQVNRILGPGSVRRILVTQMSTLEDQAPANPLPPTDSPLTSNTNSALDAVLAKFRSNGNKL